MSIIRVLFLSVAALGSGAAASKPEPARFDGAWMQCETWQGARVCGYKRLVQRGDRVCGVQQDFATNRMYRQRFVGTAQGRSMMIERICGDPGSETDTYCAGEAPQGAERTGWGASDRSLHLCGGRLFGADGGAGVDCATAPAAAGLPRVRTLGDEALAPGEEAWLRSCAAGAE